MMKTPHLFDIYIFRSNCQKCWFFGRD